MIEEALFAGGCFWCTEAAFEETEGVISLASGYTGGESENPTYEEVCTGKTGHYEALHLSFDPERITYWQLLEIFWRHIDPFDPEGQFFDKGPQYQTVIFYYDERQKALAEESRACVAKPFNERVATKILPVKKFYPAEEYHQGYCTKNPEHFSNYAKGHEERLIELWENIYTLPTENLKEKLTPLQYKVTQEEGTERAFHNTYWDNKEEGIYVDIVSGEPLFSSEDKYDSGTGWPSFTKPINSEVVETREDHKLFSTRIEVRGAKSGAHLGHVFPDGPLPTHLRYCLNSAALKFIKSRH